MPRQRIKIIPKKCLRCGKEIEKSVYHSVAQYQARKFCGKGCSQKVKKNYKKPSPCSKIIGSYQWYLANNSNQL